MHTHSFDIKGFGRVIFLVNGDWSGDALIKWPVEGKENLLNEASLPAELLVGLSRQTAISYIRDEMIGFLENIDGDDACLQSAVAFGVAQAEGLKLLIKEEVFECERKVMEARRLPRDEDDAAAYDAHVEFRKAIKKLIEMEG